MGKKSSLKPNRFSNVNSNDPSSQMVTQQEEKMFYTSKQLTQQDSKWHESATKSRNPPDDEDDYEYEDMDQIEFSNLNQTSAEQITEFINRLIAKNKVSSKNAFDIPLIHLEQMEDFRAALNDNTWKRLSSTLQNDYKIYGYRVDAAHTITYKMVESIARHQATIQQTTGFKRQIIPKVSQSIKISNENQSMQSFLEISLAENVSNNKLNVDYGKFIEKNHHLLNVGHIQSFFGYNPGLERTKRKFDQQGFKALLLNNIPLRNGCELKLDEHYYGQNDGQDERAKKQAHLGVEIYEENNIRQTQVQNLLVKIFNDQENNKIVVENEENHIGIFDQIWQANKKQTGNTQNDFDEIQRLYRIISREGRPEGKNQKKKTGQQTVVEKSQIQTENVQPNFSNLMPEEIASDLTDQQNLVQQNENDGLQPIAEENCLVNNINSYNVTQNLAIQSNLATNSPFKQSPQKLNPNGSKKDQIRNSLHQQAEQNQPNQLDQQTDHVLANKNFEMKQLNLQNFDQNSNQSLDPLNPYNQLHGNIKNIQEYIKLRQSKQKRQKKAKINIDELSSQEIGKRLFNRKSQSKKIKNIKIQPKFKKESEAFVKIQKVDWTKMATKSNTLKRSLIFKKSLTEERTFNQIKQKIKLKIQQKKSRQDLQKQHDLERNKKSKKQSRMFDLPVYQFEEQDVNFINPIDQIDPQTCQLEYSQIYKRNYPSFVFESCQIVESIRRKRQLKMKEAEKQNINSKTNNDNENQQPQKMNAQEPIFEQASQQLRREGQQENSENISPDISFIYDEIGKIKSNQVVIRQAKQKVRRILLAMLNHIKSKDAGKKKQNKISFKKIYEAYYRQQGYISPALCFLTILHLANQHNLVLEGKEDGSNFKVYIEDQNNMQPNCESQQQLNHTKIYLEASFLDREDSSLSSMRIEQQN